MSDRDLVNFRRLQILHRFDLAEADLDLPLPPVELLPVGEPWRIGAVIGPSGSGKTRFAQANFPPETAEIPVDPRRSLAMHFAEVPFRRMTEILGSVGLVVPRTWLRPLGELSAGERFRAEAAVRLSAGTDTIVLDEFARTLDDDTARGAISALGRAVRGGAFGPRLVAVGCAPERLPLLGPDWVLELPEGRLIRSAEERFRPKPRPPLDIRPCRREVWRTFAPHHYLARSLPRPAACRVALLDGRPVAFAAVAGIGGRPGMVRIARLVTLPQFQGCGIGGALLDAVAAEEHAAGRRVRITTGHPAVARHLESRAPWRITAFHPLGRRPSRTGRCRVASWGRPVVTAEYGPPTEKSAIANRPAEVDDAA